MAFTVFKPIGFDNTHILRQLVDRLPLKTLFLMNWTAALLLAGCLQVSAAGYSQGGITLSAKNIPLNKVFASIKEQTGYTFWYDESVLKNTTNIDIDVKEATLEQTLAICCKNQPIAFSIVGRMVVIKEKKGKEVNDQSNRINVKGWVINEQGDPVPGVTVMVKGSQNGTMTDVDGIFNIYDVDDNAILIFSGVNVEPQEEKINGRKEFIVLVKVRVSKLDEIQVIGYGTTIRKLNTGNVSTVSAETIQNQPISNPLAALEGQVPGLQISQKSGVPGGNFNVLIRGQNSIANGNNPLYIVDGVPFTGTSISSLLLSSGITGGGSPLSAFNPSDIESIDVLKDADATAIYGSRGASGVILITTKMGKAGKSAVDLNFNTGLEKVTRFMPLLNTPDYLRMRHEAFLNDGEQPDPYVDYDILSWDTTRNTDWERELFGRTAHLSNLEASISGGNNNSMFILGGGFNRETTVFPGSFADQKISGHFAMKHSSDNHRFKINFSASYVSEMNDMPSLDNTSQAFTLPPDAPPIYDSAGKLNWANGTFSNPYALLNSVYKANTENLIINATISYEILPHLQFRVSSGYSRMQMDETQTDPLSSLNPSWGYTSGYSYFSDQSIRTWILEPQIEYSYLSAYGHVDFLVGATRQENQSAAKTLYANGFSNDQLIEDIAAASSINQAGADQSTYRYQALFARINYNWQEKYLLNITGRRDGSSRFGPDKQFANFGAIGVGWIFSKEDFFKNNSRWLSFGKLRSSYGTTGNDQIGDYQYLDTWIPTVYPYQGLSGLQPSRLFNPDYGWEINKKWEIGLELGFINDRILLSSSYYQNRSSNQLVGYPLPMITGFSSIQQNLGATVQNTGWEFEINTSNIKSKKFTWATSFNLTVPDTRLIAYPNLAGSPYAHIYIVGKSLYIKQNFKSTGVDPQTGLYTFKDVNKDGIISSPNDYVGNRKVAQQFYGMLGNQFRFKNWQFSFDWQFVEQTGRNYLYSNFSAPGMPYNQPELVLHRWQRPGDASVIQKYTQDYGGAGYEAYYDAVLSELTISDASFIRLKNVYLSYGLSSEMLEKLHIQKLAIYLKGQNLLTISHYQGIDPENQTVQSLPPLKVFSAGIQLTF
jgi:TonB-linked SusC/RagA family outer membrane protein